MSRLLIKTTNSSYAIKPKRLLKPYNKYIDSSFHPTQFLKPFNIFAFRNVLKYAMWRCIKMYYVVYVCILFIPVNLYMFYPSYIYVVCTVRWKTYFIQFQGNSIYQNCMLFDFDKSLFVHFLFSPLYFNPLIPFQITIPRTLQKWKILS